MSKKTVRIVCLAVVGALLLTLVAGGIMSIISMF